MISVNMFSGSGVIRIFYLIILMLIIIHPSAASDIDYVKILSELDRSKGDRVKAEEINKKGLAAYNKKYFDQAQELWLEASRTDPSWWMPFFNFGCIAALKGQKEKSFICLEMALSRDPLNALPSYKKDSDLNSLKKFPEYEELLAKYDKSKSTAKSNAPLNSIRNLIGKSYKNQKNGFGFYFSTSGKKVLFDFGGPAEIGGSVYEVTGCAESRGGIDLKLKYDDNDESLIRMIIVDDKTIRLNFIKNFNWVTEKTMDFILD